MLAGLRALCLGGWGFCRAMPITDLLDYTDCTDLIVDRLPVEFLFEQSLFSGLFSNQIILCMLCASVAKYSVRAMPITDLEDYTDCTDLTVD